MSVNAVVLEGTIVSREVLRVSPGGVAVLNLTLKHESLQHEGGAEVMVEVEIEAVAFGDVAHALNGVTEDSSISIKGFLSRKNRFSPMLMLHITQFKLPQ
ncbi:MAG: primosomal replication protein N [Betaproteobacteria bacterium]|nr:primosomal replication protein N [Betaproteobacteria bacterium]